MAAASNEHESSAAAHDEPEFERIARSGKSAGQESSSEEEEEEQEEDDDEDGDEEAEEEEDEADEEPKLKYTRLTSSLAPVYRNGDATSTFLVAGDKMVGRMLPPSSLTTIC